MATIKILDYSFLFTFNMNSPATFKQADVKIEISGFNPEHEIDIQLIQNPEPFHGSILPVRLKRKAGITDGTLNFTLTDFEPGTGALGPEARELFLQVLDYNVPTTNDNSEPAKNIHLDDQHDYLYSKKGLETVGKKVNVKMKQKNFFQEASADKLRLGKDGGIIAFANGKLNSYGKDGTALANMAVADAVADEDAVTLKQLNEKFGELSKKGALVITDLVSSSNPWSVSEIRITPDLGFQIKTAKGTEIFTPADGTPLTVAQGLKINKGKIIDGGADLFTDHVYIYNEPTGQLYDNGAVASEANNCKKLPVVIDSSGSPTGLEHIPANAHVIGAEVIVDEAFDGTVNNLKLEFGGNVLVDFSMLDLSEVSKMPVPAYKRESSNTLPTVSGNISGGTKGNAVVLIEYVMS